MDLVRAYLTYHILTRINIQTTGLAFGGTGLCSYRVRDVDNSLCKAFNCKILYGRHAANIHTYYYPHKR